MTIKIGRNDPCSCGSGKKYKRCCGSATLTADSGEVTAPGVKPVVVVGDPKMLYNRVEREAKIVAENFDTLCRDNTDDIEEIYVAATTILIAGMKSAQQHNDDIRQTLSVVLSNAFKSFTAAFSLLRTGWRLQPYQCLRNCMEAISVTLHLFKRPTDLEKFKADKLDSTATFKSAKEFMEPFGLVYGELSKQFTHVGKPFRHVQRGNTYTADEEDLWACLGMLMCTVWLLYQVVELVFLDCVAQPMFWREVAPGQYQRRFSPEASEWNRRLVARYKEFIPERPSKSIARAKKQGC
jgi:hypothetical protein